MTSWEWVGFIYIAIGGCFFFWLHPNRGRVYRKGPPWLRKYGALICTVIWPVIIIMGIGWAFEAGRKMYKEDKDENSSDG